MFQYLEIKGLIWQVLLVPDFMKISSEFNQNTQECFIMSEGSL